MASDTTSKVARKERLRLVLLVLSLVGVAAFWYMTRVHKMTSETLDADVTIVGAGLAGLTAGLETAAQDPGLRIVIVEKEMKVGGNSAKASSGINAAISDDDEHVFEQDTLRSGGGLSVENLVQVFVQKSPSGLEFLQQHGVDLSVKTQLGGHSAKRTHRNKNGPNVGFAIVSALHDKVKTTRNIQVLNGYVAKHLFFTDTNGKTTDSKHGRLSSVEIVDSSGVHVTINTKAVILATGGYSASSKMLKQYAPHLTGFPTTNGAWAQGEGINLAKEIGANLVLMDKVQLHPTGFVNPKDRDAQQRFLAPEAIRGAGAVLFNEKGKRFVSELATRDVVSNAMLEQEMKGAYMWLFAGASELQSSLGFYQHMGLVTSVRSVKEAAEYCGFDPAIVMDELNAYAAASQGEIEDPFGKSIFPYPLQKTSSVDEDLEIFVMEVSPVVHYCMGGIEIDESARVLRPEKSIIPNVYATGEVSGGLHGANRLGGNSLAECVVFGRIAAQEAIQQIYNGKV